MTKDEADQRAEQLAQTDPDRKTHRFVVRESSGGDWEVVRISLPPAGDLVAETRAEEKPPTPDDPRDSFGPNVPGYTS